MADLVVIACNELQKTKLEANHINAPAPAIAGSC